MIKYIHPVRPSSAQGLVADVYSQVKRDFGRVAEPFIVHSPLPQLLAGAWIACRETELAGNVPREIKETVAAAVSQSNRCPYCVDAHTIMLDAAGQKEAANAISNSYGQISDTKMRLIAEWATATTQPTSAALRLPPFSQQQAPEIIGTAVFYHYMNRMAIVLLGDTPLPSNQRWLRKPLTRIASNMFRKTIIRPKGAGESLQLLPRADLPNDLRWAKPAPNVAAAYASFAAAVDNAGEYALPLAVRAFIQEEVDGWRGETSELSLAWSEDAISRLDKPTQAAADLALLTALAPQEVDEETVLAFKKYFPEDGKLVGALSWASFTAARKIGTWTHTACMIEQHDNPQRGLR